MAEVRFSELAANDLESILIYSAETFGSAVAETYELALKTCLERIAADLRVGRQFKGGSRDFRAYVCRRHMIFYLL